MRFERFLPHAVLFVLSLFTQVLKVEQTTAVERNGMLFRRKHVDLNRRELNLDDRVRAQLERCTFGGPCRQLERASCKLLWKDLTTVEARAVG